MVKGLKRKQPITGYLGSSAVLLPAVFALAALLLPAGASAGTLDQSQPSFNSAAGFFSTNQLAQTFTAGQTGELDQVDLSLAKFCDETSNGVLVDLRTVSADGEPTSTALASAALDNRPESTVPGPLQFLPVPFVPPASVVAGTKYAIVVSAPSSPDCSAIGPSPYAWGQSDGDVYSAGQQFASANGGMTWDPRTADHAFRTYVDVPPPLDTDPPETTITKDAPRKLPKRKVKFKFTSDEEVEAFQCRFKRRPWVAWRTCESGDKFGPLREGKQKFFVRAIDKAGNYDPTPAKDKFKVVD